MAETRGDHAVKGKFVVSDNATFEKGLKSPYLEVIDQKATGSAGGTFNGQNDEPGATAWKTRDLTNVIFNDFATTVTLAASAGEGPWCDHRRRSPRSRRHPIPLERHH